MNRRTAFRLLWIGSTLLLPGAARAAVVPHPLFSDGVVLQRDLPVPVWGTADEGEKVTVRLLDQEASTEAKDGKWMVRLKPLKAGGPYTLTIEGKEKITVKDVLIGEVWVCSGQSNMAMVLSRTADGPKSIESSADPMLRLFTVPRKVADAPQSEFESPDPRNRAARARWHEAGPKTSGTFSAVGYYFGRDLRARLNVPIGLINSSVGGTPAEAWTSRGALEADPDYKPAFAFDAAMLKNYPKALERYEEGLPNYRAAAAAAKKEGKPIPKAPVKPLGAEGTGRPAVLYNGMIAPLQPFAIRGAIWYQGEGNARRAFQYQKLLSALIKSWREAWGQGDFSFLVVQLAPFHKIQENPGDSEWAELREAQLRVSQNVPMTGLAVITDVGEETDIHPTHKTEVGVRLAQAARAVAYGEKILPAGPEFTRLEIKEDRAILQFKNVGEGLTAKDGPLKGFTIAGEDRVFRKAEAEIEGDTVVVHAASVSKPVAVRYGWADFPVVNLWNKDGLPATPFRTDDFPGITRLAPRNPAPAKAARATTN